jgi:hypothetical protein
MLAAVVLSVALAPIAAQTSISTSTFSKDQGAAARERLRSNMVFLLADDTRRTPGMENRTDEQRHAIRRLVIAMFDDDLVLEELMQSGSPQPTTPAAALQVFTRIMMTRSKVVESRLDDADLDEVETSTPDSVAKSACPGLGGQVDLDALRTASTQISARSFELIAKGWEALNRGDPAPEANITDVGMAVGHLMAVPEARAAIAAVNNKDPSITRSPEETCAQAMVIRKAMLGLPRAERIALTRVALNAVSGKAVPPKPVESTRTIVPGRPSIEASALLQPAKRVFQLADMKLDLDDERSIAVAADLDPRSPLVPGMRRLFIAFAANGTVQPIIAHATDPSAPWRAAKLVGAIRSYAFEIVVHGLRRLDDDTLLAIRPILAKAMIEKRPENCPQAVLSALSGKIPPEIAPDELLALLDVATLAVDAMNRHRPVIDKSDDEKGRGTDEAAEALSDDEALQYTAAFASSAPAEGCKMLAVTTKLYLSPSTRSTAPMREYLSTLVVAAERPKQYAPGDSLDYPRPGGRVGAEGTQRVEVKVDSDGRVTAVKVTMASFEPATLTLADGTEIPTAQIFEKEVDAWVRARSFKDKIKDSTRTETTFAFPVNWKMPQ